jgi:predicted aspartyl protease
MGLTFVTLQVRKNKESKQSIEHELLVDSGAVYTVMPAKLLRQLDVVADAQETFTLANGERLTRWTGDAYFEYQGKGGYSKVVFGDEGDMSLLGALTLEACGWILDPLKRQLRPLPMLLA